MRSIQNNMLLASESATSLFQKTARGGYILRGDRTLLCLLAENRVYQTPTELWITHDPHARAMLRHAAADEAFVEGAGSDFEKFRIFCTVMEQSVGNPLQLQCHMALRELFDCELLLNETNCEKIWRIVCETLSCEDLTPCEYVKKCGVDTVTVPLAPWELPDDLDRVPELRVLPVFAPDAYFLPTGKAFSAAVRALDGEICDFKSFCKALLASFDRFAASGCRVATHGVLPDAFSRPNEYHAALYFEKALAGEVLAPNELALYQAQLWRVLSQGYAMRDITMELRVGETPAKNEINHPVSGVNSVTALKELLDYLKERVGLPRVAVYAESAAQLLDVAALAARYPAIIEGVPQIALGVWQSAPADVRAQLRALASVAPLSECLGALPDARLPYSALSPALFHRTLCTELADWELHGETDSGEEILCRVIARLTGENMQKYYQL